MLRVIRRGCFNQALIGEMWLDGEFLNYTLEDYYSIDTRYKAIPIGRYSMDITMSNRFKELMPLINVPGRTGIRIHPGNTHLDVTGCILVGTHIEITKNRTFLGLSRVAFQKLLPLLDDVKLIDISFESNCDED